jgi:proteasome lid subunit RPN8/RPN11
MSLLRKKNPPQAGGTPGSSGDAAREKVTASAWKTAERPVRRHFPGPKGATARLRVALDRPPYAELIAHAKETLDKEVCGVLVGTVCEDDQGLFVHVAAAIRGTAASEGSTHVTFTHETWTRIHARLEREYPRLQILGWYHSHPGFGVEFSEMDLFIQKNFFPGEAQLALVMDPLNGAVAICVNTPRGIEYVERFWVEGREQPCQVPKEAQHPEATGSPGAAPGDIHASLQSLEARLGQLIQTIDDQRTSLYRFLLILGMLACTGIVVAVGYSIYSNYRYRNEPPRLNQYIPIPLQVGDRTVLVGVGVAEWRVPDELNAMMVAVEREKQALALKALLEGSNGPSVALPTTNLLAPTNLSAPKK